jgi:hypothetical protein
VQTTTTTSSSLSSLVYYIVDAGRRKDSCDLISDSDDARLIIVAEPNKEQWGGRMFTKHLERTFMHYPVWSLEELLASSTFFTVLLSDKEIKRRFSIVGGIPGYIFATNFEHIESAQHHSMSMLSSQSMESIAFHSDARKAHYVHGVDKDLILSFHLKDNDNGTYKNRYASLCSHSVYTYVANNFMKELWSGMVCWYGGFGTGFDTGIYDAFTMQLFYNPGQCKLHATDQNFNRRSNNNTNATEITIGGCYRMNRVDDIVAAVIDSPMILFAPISMKRKRIDYTYRDGNVYHFFQSNIYTNCRTADATHIVDFILKVLAKTAFHILQPQQQGSANQLTTLVDSLSFSSMIDLIPKFQFYYVVPRVLTDRFVNDHVNPIEDAKLECQKQIGKNAALFVHWEKIVSIKVLCVNQPD